MRFPDVPVTKRSLFSWVFAYNLHLQVILLAVIIVTVFARVLPLEMQKRVVNEAIKLRDEDLLMLYCGIYLVSVLAASGLKYLINILQTLIGQRALAEMRKALFHHLLTLPLSFFRKTQPGLVVASLVNELVAAGDFAGEALAVPITSLLTLVVFAVYLAWLNPILAAVSLSIYPVVLLIIPLLQQKANQANKKRVDVTRQYSDIIVESVSGIHEVQGNGSYRIENRRHDQEVENLRKIRVRWNLLRFGIKTTNNFFTNLSPFLIFIIGGYLTIRGRLELGALVAFLSAQEKLYDPWKELIEFYQSYQDAIVRYRRTMEYFDAVPEYQLAPVDRAPFHLRGDLEVQNLSFATEGGILLLQDINLSLAPGEHLALVGFSGSGKSTLALCVGQLYRYTGGHVLMDGREVAEMTKSDIVNNVGFVSQSPFIFGGTIQSNLLYGCEARRQAAGEESTPPMPTLDQIIEVLQQTGIFVDVLRFGLNARLSPQRDGDLMEVLVRVRANFQRDFGEALADSVEFFNEQNFLHHASIAENLIFGTASDPAFETPNLPQNTYFLEFLARAELTRPLLRLGAELARQTVDILGNLPPQDIFFRESPIQPEELEDYKQIVQRLDKEPLAELPAGEREKLLILGLRFTPARHKTVALSGLLEKRVTTGRALFKASVERDFPQALAFYQPAVYIHSETILNNILFGKAKSSGSQAEEKINHSIVQVLIEEDLLERIIEIGMTFDVGSKGDRLSGGQRQKVAIARAFLKNPEILIMDEATSALDNKSQARIQRLLEARFKGRTTLIAVLHRLDIVKNFDQIAVMKAGKIVELGPYEELMNRKGTFYELVTGRK
jgi:ABC-type multidrug transport system fused ATPase/permease subunit